MRRLLIFAYAFDETSQVFSHQIGVIQSLSKEFDQTVVIAAQVGAKELQEYSGDPKSKNRIIVIQADFSRKNSHLRNAQRFLALILFLKNFQFHTVFYFMTETSAALFGAYFKVSHTRQVLWYAHARKSYRLVIASFFVDLICSSTKGSMPLDSNKIRLIGQMVDEKLFPYSPKALSRDLTLIHYGRFDESKNIGFLLQVAERLVTFKSKMRLKVIGSPSTRRSIMYQKQIMENFIEIISSGRVEILPACLRSQLSQHLMESDIFLHAFQGSLDKSLVEATLVGMPVVTLNQEYLREFGTWSKASNGTGADLVEFLLNEVRAILSLSSSSLQAERFRRYKIALENHSLAPWTAKMSKLLLESDKD
jgi:glycosyltransferase involved in cell wall biosynthesis